MATWLEPLAAQVTGIRLDDATIAAVVRVLDEPSAPALGRAPPPDALRAAASGVPRDFAAGKLDVAAFTAAIADLTAEEEALDQGEAGPPRPLRRRKRRAYLGICRSSGPKLARRSGWIC